MLAAASLRRITRVVVHSRNPGLVAHVGDVVRRGYHENIIEHYENPRNVGSLDKDDNDVGTVSFGMGEVKGGGEDYYITVF
jgi:hypothetical protein